MESVGCFLVLIKSESEGIVQPDGWPALLSAKTKSGNAKRKPELFSAAADCVWIYGIVRPCDCADTDSYGVWKFAPCTDT